MIYEDGNNSSDVNSEYMTTNNEEDEINESKRKSRNLCEKKRRDQFNRLLHELSSVVSVSSSKMDKATVLKATINTLKIHYENLARSKEYEISEEWKPSFITNEEYTYLMLETVGGFIIAFSSCGKILYVSSSIAAVLGYLMDEILTLNIYDLVLDNDRSYLENMFFISTVNNYCKQEVNELHFRCHLLKKSLDGTKYEPMEFSGRIKPYEAENSQSDKEENIKLNKHLIFVGIVRLLAPQLYTDVIFQDHIKLEFVSHHNFEWKFLFLDERAPPIIGYSAFELQGTSGYDYYHVDDLDNVISYHKALMTQDEGVSGYYRFLTKGQQWIWLQTASYITRRQWNSKIEFIVCTHRVKNPPFNQYPEETGLKLFENISPLSSSSSGLESTPSLSSTTSGLKSNPPLSSNGSISGTSKTLPPSWQSTTPERNCFEEEDINNRYFVPPCADYLGNDSSVSSSSSRNLFYYGEKKSSKKCHQYRKSITDFLGNHYDTNSNGNGNGYHPSNNSIRRYANTVANMKFENIPSSGDDLENNSILKDSLQKKCTELEQIIARRQEELRVVSEQLLLAKCNLQQTNDPHSFNQ